MSNKNKKIGDQRYRESYGRYFEEFEIGDVYEHRPGRTITESDNTWFTLMTMNTHPLHFDKEYAKHSEFGQPLVVSSLTLSIVAGMSVSDTSQKAIANLGWTDIVMPAPVFVGDTLYAESEVMEKRASKSRPNQGLVGIETRGFKQGGAMVMSFKRTMLIPFRGHGVDDKIEAAEG
jgi:acyl dehydratase